MTAAEPYPAAELAWLRARWPHWGFLYVRPRWVAVQGKVTIITATSVEALCAQLPPARRQRHEPLSIPPPGRSSNGRRSLD